MATDMLVKLYDLPEEAERFAAAYSGTNITIRRALPPEKHIVTAWVGEVFSPHWVSECEVAFTRQPVSCWIATVTDEVTGNVKPVGFACYDTTAKGFFGPTGVDPDLRGQGIGKALLYASLVAMRNEGYGYAVIGSAGPTDFYARTVGAIPIADSTPGVYKGMLR
ncbi:GNAT superfamily N-acetyltransferase [Paenibacillus castaneae]|uniref:GNAT family N-acetyltransferase n=1 Tax=Paenibacillus castaneae TaxID=474957 RepID=UPI000C9B9D91|nr:GNAT family N-acetyltransferase [Paenibacillus castaneae]NIK76777.1 GNAT superfamily N-acetyltransferase [Paenibacillus castaneae]